MSKENCEEITLISEKLLTDIKNKLPSNSAIKFIYFTETLRILDFYSVTFDNSSANTNKISDYYFMKLGWNLSASFLFEGISAGGFPISESNKQTFDYTGTLLHSFGRITMLKRTIDMIKSGEVLVTKADNVYTFKKNKNISSQGLDDLEFEKLERLEMELQKKTGKHYNEWSVLSRKNLGKAFYEIGNFIGLTDKDYSIYILKNIDELLAKQVRPWDSKNGIMTGYDSTPEIDTHFLAEALELVHKWQFQAGLHPKTQIGNITGYDISLVVIYLTSLHLKHIRCCLVASKKYPKIHLAQSLTIWTSLKDLIRDVIHFSDLDESIILEVFESVMLKPEDIDMLKTHTSNFKPLIIDIGNGFALRPISSIYHNPFITINQILEYRNPNFINNLSLLREEWLREHLYAMFSGVKYITIDGNIKLRTGKKLLTDIDAAIFDRTTGDLALFQIKWQDFFFNDVRKLKSRANNLTKGLDSWARKVNDWINVNGIFKLTQTLRLKLKGEKPINKVHLFAISKNAARMEEYGFSVKNNHLAIANWPQFIRNRHEIGPSKRVFFDLFEALKDQEKDVLETTPLPTKFVIDGNVFIYEDIFSTY